MALTTLQSCSGDAPSGLKADPSAALQMVDGQDQRAVAGTKLPSLLVVKVVHAAGRPATSGAPFDVNAVGGVAAARGSFSQYSSLSVAYST